MEIDRARAIEAIRTARIIVETGWPEGEGSSTEAKVLAATVKGSLIVSLVTELMRDPLRLEPPGLLCSDCVSELPLPTCHKCGKELPVATNFSRHAISRPPA